MELFAVAFLFGQGFMVSVALVLNNACSANFQQSVERVKRVRDNFSR